jgi:hypothetical protein
MGLPPLAYTSAVIWAAKVVFIFLFLQPTLLTGLLASLTAGWSIAVVLPFCVTGFRYEQPIAILAFFSVYPPHCWSSSWGIDIAQKVGFTLTA